MNALTISGGSTANLTMSSREIAAFAARTMQSETGCIEWTGPMNEQGYGRFTFKRRQSLAHRASWRLFRGELPPGMCVLHRCDNPRCVNPEHLFIGDRGDNARDMAAKGRQWLQRNPERARDVLSCPKARKARGSAHGNAILTEDAVLKIRSRSASGERSNLLAAEFHCSETLISQVILGHIWRHVGGPIKAKAIAEKPAKPKTSPPAAPEKSASTPEQAPPGGEGGARKDQAPAREPKIQAAGAARKTKGKAKASGRGAAAGGKKSGAEPDPYRCPYTRDLLEGVVA